MFQDVTLPLWLLILIVGWSKGFSALERMEQVSVGIKLAIIAGLLFEGVFGKQIEGGRVHGGH